MPSTPTARTLEHCRLLGWKACVVERYNAFTRRRHDAYGFGDLLVLDDEPGALLIQTTSRPNIAARVRKILSIPEAMAWLAAGNRIQVWGWGKTRKGKRKAWTVRIVDITRGKA